MQPRRENANVVRDINATPSSDAPVSSGVGSGGGGGGGLPDAPQGSILYRGATGWVALPPDTAKEILATNGNGANPEWVNTITRLTVDTSFTFPVSSSF